jgi:hypothetical protein
MAQAILSEERSDELYCVDSRKNGKSQKRFEAAFFFGYFLLEHAKESNIILWTNKERTLLKID